MKFFFSHEPDLIHDVFGHIPSLFDPGYRRMLELWASKASLVTTDELDLVSYHLSKLIALRHAEFLPRRDGQDPSSQMPSKDFESLGAFAHLLSAASDVAKFSHASPSLMILYDKLYFWIFEFGILGQSVRERKILGAGLLTSMSELDKVATGLISVKPLTVASLLTNHLISQFQESYLLWQTSTPSDATLSQLMSSILNSSKHDQVLQKARA